MMRRLVCIPIFLLVLLLGACAGIFANVPAPETPRERLAVLEISFQETNRTIQDLVAAGTLHGSTAVRVGDLLKAVHITLQAARAGVDGPDGLFLLDTANDALIRLTARLREMEK